MNQAPAVVAGMALAGALAYGGYLAGSALREVWQTPAPSPCFPLLVVWISASQRSTNFPEPVGHEEEIEWDSEVDCVLDRGMFLLTCVGFPS